MVICYILKINNKSSVPVNPFVAFTTVYCRVIGEPVHGVDCGDDVAEWLTDVLYNGTTQVRLVYKGSVMEDRPPRKMSYYTFPQYRETDRVNVTCNLVSL